MAKTLPGGWEPVPASDEWEPVPQDEGWEPVPQTEPKPGLLARAGNWINEKVSNLQPSDLLKVSPTSLLTAPLNAVRDEVYQRTVPEPTRQKIEQGFNEPLVDVTAKAKQVMPAEWSAPTSTAGKYALGAMEGGGDVVSGFTSPKMIAELIGSKVAPGYALTFLPGLIQGTYEGGKEALQGYQENDPQRTARGAVGALTSLLFAAGLGKHSLDSARAGQAKFRADQIDRSAAAMEQKARDRVSEQMNQARTDLITDKEVPGTPPQAYTMREPRRVIVRPSQAPAIRLPADLEGGPSGPPIEVTAGPDPFFARPWERALPEQTATAYNAEKAAADAKQAAIAEQAAEQRRIRDALSGAAEDARRIEAEARAGRVGSVSEGVGAPGVGSPQLPQKSVILEQPALSGDVRSGSESGDKALASGAIEKRDRFFNPPEAKPEAPKEVPHTAEFLKTQAGLIEEARQRGGFTDDDLAQYLSDTKHDGKRYAAITDSFMRGELSREQAVRNMRDAARFFRQDQQATSFAPGQKVFFQSARGKQRSGTISRQLSERDYEVTSRGERHHLKISQMQRPAGVRGAADYRERLVGLAPERVKQVKADSKAFDEYVFTNSERWIGQDEAFGMLKEAEGKHEVVDNELKKVGRERAMAEVYPEGDPLDPVDRAEAFRRLKEKPAEESKQNEENFFKTEAGTNQVTLLQGEHAARSMPDRPLKGKNAEAGDLELWQAKADAENEARQVKLGEAPNPYEEMPGANVAKTPDVILTGKTITTNHPLYGKRPLKIIEEYNDQHIALTDSGHVAVVSKDGETVFFPALDDGTGNKKWVKSEDSVEGAKRYLDWLKKSEKKAEEYDARQKRMNDSVEETARFFAKEGKPEATAKEPWEMTREEYNSKLSETARRVFGSFQHRNFVLEALASGERVPDYVKAEYPGIEKEASEVSSNASNYAMKRAESMADDASAELSKQRIRNEEERKRIESEGARVEELSYKEPWEITLKQYVVGGRITKGLKEAHRSEIERALSEGKPVPPEVLKDYPDLAKGSESAQTPREQRLAEIERLKKEHASVLATPLASEGSISPVQIGRMSKGQREKWQSNAQKRMDIEQQIRNLGKSDEEIAASEKRKADAARSSRISQLNAEIRFLTDVGKGKRGTIKPKYAAKIEEAKRELSSLEGAQTETATPPKSGFFNSIAKTLKSEKGATAIDLFPGTEAASEALKYNTKWTENLDPKVREGIQDAMQKQQPFVDQMAGRKVTLEEIESAAQREGITWAEVEKLKQGDVLNSKKTVALQNLLAYTSGRIETLKKSTMETLQDPANKTAIAELTAKMFRLTAILEGVRSEAGRALGTAWRINANPQDAVTRYLGRMLKEMPEKQQAQLMQEWAKIQPGDISAQVKALQKYTKHSFIDKIIEARNALLLTSPATHMANILGNAGTTIYTVPEMATTGIVDLIRSKVTRTPQERFVGEAYKYTVGLVKGLPEACRNMVSALKDETFRSGPLKTEELFGKGAAIKGTTGTVIRTPYRLLGAMDEFFRTMNRMGFMRSEEYRAERMKKPASAQENAAEAERRAAENIFQEDLGALGKAINHARVKDPSGVLRVLMPFFKTPVNIAKYVYRRTPLGVLSPRNLSDIKAGGGKSSEAVSRIVFGSIVSASFTALALDGQITGGGPSDPKERRAWLRSNQPYSIKIGGKWISYQRFEPLSKLMSGAAAIADAYRFRDEYPTDQLVGKLVADMGKSWTDTSFMTGINDTLNALSDPGRYGGKFITRMATGVVTPPGMAWAAREMDPYVRDPKGFKQELMARVPGMSENVPPKRDLWGNPVEHNQPKGFFGVIPTKVSEEKADPVDQEMMALGINTDIPSNKIHGVEIPQDLYDKFVERTGQRSKIVLDALVKAPGWENVNDFEKEKVITGVINKVRDEEREMLLPVMVKRRLKEAPDVDAERKKIELEFFGKKGRPQAPTAPQPPAKVGKLASVEEVKRVYGTEIAEAAKTYGLDENDLARQIFKESTGDPNAVSQAGARGLMQVMPKTAAGMGMKLDTPREQIMAGARYMADMLRSFKGDRTLAYAAYNAGPGNVRKHGGVPPNRETRNYVAELAGKNQSN